MTFAAGGDVYPVHTRAAGGCASALVIMPRSPKNGLKRGRTQAMSCGTGENKKRRSKHGAGTGTIGLTRKAREGGTEGQSGKRAPEGRAIISKKRAGAGHEGVWDT